MSNRDSTFNFTEILFALEIKGKVRKRGLKSKTRGKRFRLGHRVKLYGVRDNSAERTTISSPDEQLPISIYLAEKVGDKKTKDNQLNNKPSVYNTRSDCYLLTVIISKSRIGTKVLLKKVSSLASCTSETLKSFQKNHVMISTPEIDDLNKELISLVNRKLLYSPYQLWRR
ncbi:hypothetical protein [Stygiolobus sp. CP8521M]|uniref:hypothetical protein n=1 Tax=Stygiolobus sp. CP8521M TaxID=3133136 RepID=UPI00307CF9D2